jgi:hypothetical protein
MDIIEELRQMRGMISAKEVADLIGMNLDVLYRKCKAAKPDTPPHFRYNGQVKFDPRKLANWLEAHEVCAGKVGPKL